MPEDLPANTPPTTAEPKRRPNAPLWLGFLVVVFAFLSYLPIFARYPSTRDMPWANFLLFALGLALLFVGLRRAFAQSQLYRGKIAGPVLTALGLAALALFCVFTFSL
jgi:4-amino-4-deoxy-L-arabinose transferase-like glycosyltransferase